MKLHDILRLMEQATSALTASQRKPVTWRSVGLGTLGVLFVCGLTPFNNYVLNNSDLVGCYLPTSVLLLIGALVLIVNPLMARLWPGRELSRGELATIMVMTMIGCAFPAGGLMRYLPGNLTGIYHHSAQNADYQHMLEEMHLPDWMFPSFQTKDVQSRGNELVIRGFVGRVANEGGWSSVTVVPWLLWLKPAAAWGLFIAALYGSIICIVCIFRRQWMDNERLPFPIASVLSSLIEPPERGRWLNAMLRSKLFWWAFGGVFLLHAFNALYIYNPRWPAVPLTFDMTRILSNAPFSLVDDFTKKQVIYFAVIGITCLIETRLSLSLWVFYLLTQVAKMTYGSYQAEFSEAMENDQFFGGLVPYAMAALWVARGHLRLVFGQMIRGGREREARGRYLPYAFAGWAYVVCMAVQVMWLMAARCTLAGAVVLTLMVGLVFFSLIRIVAESGMLYTTFLMNMNLPWQYSAILPEPLTTRTNLVSNFLGNLFSGVFTHDVRQSIAVYSSTGIAVADQDYAYEKTARRAMPLVLCIFGAMVLGFVVSGASTLWVEYNYASTLDRKQETPINSWGADLQPLWFTLDPSTRYVPPGAGPHYPHSRLGHFAFGATLTSLLAWGRFSWSGFPLHPLGYLLSLTLGLRWVWFSVLLGWALKTVIIKLGGAGLYRQLKPLAMGLILGETAAAAFWLMVSLVLAMMGREYRFIQIILT